MFLIRIINKFFKEKTIPQLSEEQQIGMFSQLYENFSFRKFLDAREEYLIKQCTENFLSNKLPNAYGFAGQLLEIRNMRERIKLSWNAMDRMRKNKNHSQTSVKGREKTRSSTGA